MSKQEMSDEDYQPERKRGRPSGKNRIPLSVEERRVRNAQYERERREETAEAMRLLAEAAGCSSKMPNKLILNTAHDLVARLKNANEEVEILRQTNEAIIAEIEDLENVLSRAAKGKKVKKGKKKEQSLNKLSQGSIGSTKRHKISKTKSSTTAKPSANTNTEKEYLERASLESIAEFEGEAPQSLPSLPLYNDWSYDDPDSWTLLDPLTGAPIAPERQFSEEMIKVEIETPPEQTQELKVEVELQNPAEMDSFLCTLNDNEKTLLDEIDISALNIRSV